MRRNFGEALLVGLSLFCSGWAKQASDQYAQLIKSLGIEKK
jgi:hypothetical protein